MEDSIFTKIIKGQVPCHKIFDNDKVIAFLDIQPIVPGHVLVVPKQQISHFFELDDERYIDLFKVVKKVSSQLKKQLKCARVCVRIEGFDVDHVHVHVYPCNKPEDFYGDRLRAQKDPDHLALTAMAKKLSF